ncbi:MAG: hypothetical protein IJM59_02240 [Proteobacteria bacterium]|nr:hypothetical protein [Pseudomonadota bacterium]
MTMTLRPIWLAIALAASSFAGTACDQIEARTQAEQGKTALLNCQFEAAQYHFSRAYEFYPEHHDIQIGYAFSELLYYADTQEVRAILNRLGISENLASLCREEVEPEKGGENSDESKDDCDIFGFVGDAGTGDESESFDLEQIDPTLTWNEMIGVLHDQNDLLESAADHFDTISEFVEEDSPWRTDLFGYRDVPFHKVDFASLAFALHTLAAMVHAASAYSFDMPVYDTLRAYRDNDRTWMAGALNRTLFFPGKSGDSELAYPELIKAIKSLQTAVQYIEIIKENSESENPEDQNESHACSSRNTLFYWENMHYGILSDLKKASHIIDNSEQIMDLSAFLEPEMNVNIEQMFSNLPVRTDASDVIVEVQQDRYVWHFEHQIQQFNAFFTPELFALDAGDFSLNDDIYYRLNSAWLRWKPETLLYSE